MRIGKYLIGFLAVTVLLVASPVLGTLAGVAGLAYVGYRAFKRISDGVRRASARFGSKNDVNTEVQRTQARSRTQGESKTQAQEKGRNAYYDMQTGQFHVEELPFDMKADLAGAVGGRVSFSCAGMTDCIQGFPTEDGGYRFRFAVDSFDVARRVSEFTEGEGFRGNHGKASVMQTGDGTGYIVECGDARDIRTLLKVAFPSTSCEIEREVRTVNQYVIDGCSSYEEAVAKLELERAGLKPDNSFVERSLSVDGVERERVAGGALDPTSLAVGTYIISEVVSDVRRATVSVPGNITAPGDVADFAVSAFDAGKAERVDGRSFSEPKLFDATPENISRYLSGPEGDLHLANETSISQLVALRQPQFVFRCADMAEVESLLSGKAIPGSRPMLLDVEVPKPGPGEFFVTIPATAEMLSALKVEGSASANFLSQYSGMGITEKDINLSLIEDSLSYDGYATVRSTVDISTDGAKVNGIPMSDVAYRLGNAILPTIGTSEEMSRWLADAAEIESISVTLDAKRAELRVSSVVGGIQKTEVRKLSEVEMRDFAARREMTRVEMKDFLMQTHPDYFRTYSDGNGGCRVQDPVSSFLKGEKPRMAEAKDAAREQSPAVKPERATVQAQAPKPKKSVGIKL